MANTSNKKGQKLGGVEKGEWEEGWVAASYGELCKVLWKDAEYTCRLGGELRRGMPLVVGDRVRFERWEGKKGLVREQLPRTSRLYRRGADRKRGGRGGAQLLAANISRVLITAAAVSPSFRRGLVDRLLVAAEHAGLDAVLCVTKLDLVTGGVLEALSEPYRKLGLKVLGVVTTQRETLGELERLLAEGMSLLVGHSGVGKTSLVNTLCGGMRRVGEVSSGVGGRSERGRHTTSASQLLRLPKGGWLIDSPGLREFGPQGISPGSLGGCYPGISAWEGRCGFHNCLHREEPRCAVREAVERHELEVWRWEGYLKLLEELS